MESKHILYNNWMYHKMPNEQIGKLLRNQEKIIRFMSLLDPNDEQAAYIFYKRDCLYFELHRRTFANCMIQLASYHKVKGWIADTNVGNRCVCCKPEYYEFKFDCQRVELGELPESELISTIVSTKALEAGRCFFIEEEIPELPKDETKTVTFAENPVVINRFSVAPTPPKYLQNTTVATPAKAGKASFFSSWTNIEERCLSGLSTLKIVNEPAISGLGAIRRTNNDRFGRAFKGRKYDYRPKRYRPEVTFKDVVYERSAFCYKPLREDEYGAGPSSSNGKPSKPIWHFGFNSNKDDKDDYKKKGY